jgi:hypothetical protein
LVNSSFILGSQIIAGEQYGRVVYAMDISPAFVDMAVKRGERFSGGMPLENDITDFQESGAAQR